MMTRARAANPVLERVRNSISGRRSVRFQHAFLFQHDSLGHLIVPEHVGAGPIALGNEPIDQPGGLGGLGVIHGLHADTSLLLKTIKNRPGIHFIEGGVDHYGVRSKGLGEAEREDTKAYHKP